MDHALLLLVLALAIEAAVGYPAAIYQRIGHPVTWFGALITRLEQSGNRSELTAQVRRRNGIIAVIVLVGLVGSVAFAIQQALGSGWLALIVLAGLASTLLAQGSLDTHVDAVADALETGSLDESRAAVSRIVGRNPAWLDEHGVARAAIESLAENFADGVVAPAFWIGLAGLPGGAAYKAINTADSMIGHKNERYLDYGWAAARFDDLVNLPASRLAALWLALAALVLPGASAWRALRSVWRDAGKHRSPNAGWPEAAMAGALSLQLNGPRVYGETRVEDAYMGEGRREATAGDIRMALSLYRLACIIQWLAAAGALVTITFI